MSELTLAFQLILTGLVFDVVGAVLIAFPLWKVGNVKRAEISDDFWFAFYSIILKEDKKEWQGSGYYKRLQDQYDEIKERKRLKPVTDVKRELVNQWYARIGIITLCVGFILQGIGVWMQMNLVEA